MRFKKIAIGLLGVSLVLSACGKKDIENVYLKNGMVYIEEMNYQNAIDELSQGLEAGEDAELTLRALGIAYMGLSQYEEAYDAFFASIGNAGIKASELEVDTNFYLASACYKLGKYEEARDIYSAILKYKGKDLDAFFLRGCTYLCEQDYESARADFDQAFSMAPNDMELIIDAYEELWAAGFEEEGLMLLQDKMDSNQTSLSDAQKGTLYFYLGNYDDARIYLDQAVNHGNEEMALLLGRTYEKLGDMNYASIVYQQYIDGNNKNAEVYNNLGICYMTQGKTAEALEAFSQGIELGNSGVLQNLKFNQIVAYEKNSDFSTARKLMEEYLAFYPDDSKALREYEFLKTR